MNVPWHIAVACDSLHLRASAHLWHVSAASADVSAEQSTPNLGLYVTIQYLHSYVQKSIPDQLR